MIVSLNEIETTARKAALGVGLPLGIAEDIAQGLAWAAPLGLAIEALAVEALANIDRKRAGGYRLGQPKVSSLWLGPMVADMARAGVPARFSCEAVDIPLLTAVIVAAACNGDGAASCQVRWPTARGPCGVVIAQGVTGFHALSVAELELRDCAIDLDRDVEGIRPIVLVSSADVQRCKTVALDRGVEVEPHAWARLGQFAARMLVPASAQSRLKGAGAGDIDRG